MQAAINQSARSESQGPFVVSHGASMSVESAEFTRAGLRCFRVYPGVHSVFLAFYRSHGSCYLETYTINFGMFPLMLTVLSRDYNRGYCNPF